MSTHLFIESSPGSMFQYPEIPPLCSSHAAAHGGPRVQLQRHIWKTCLFKSSIHAFYALSLSPTGPEPWHQKTGSVFRVFPEFFSVLPALWFHEITARAAGKDKLVQWILCVGPHLFFFSGKPAVAVPILSVVRPKRPIRSWWRVCFCTGFPWKLRQLLWAGSLPLPKEILVRPFLKQRAVYLSVLIRHIASEKKKDPHTVPQNKCGTEGYWRFR